MSFLSLSHQSSYWGPGKGGSVIRLSTTSNDKESCVTELHNPETKNKTVQSFQRITRPWNWDSFRYFDNDGDAY